MRKWIEIFMIKMAVKILIGRNVHRSKFVSRRDNNDMWAMGERLEGVISRMGKDYE